MAKKGDPVVADGRESQRRVRRRWPWAALVAAVLAAAVGLVLFQVPKYLDGFSGGSTLEAELVEPVERPLELNETDTRARAPALARLLDEAHNSGRAVTSDPVGIRESLEYLDEAAKGAGARGYNSAPLSGVVEWRGDHFLILRSGA